MKLKKYNNMINEINIKELLNSIENRMKKLKTFEKEAGEDLNKVELDSIEVMNLILNLRMCLDWANNDIMEKVDAEMLKHNTKRKKQNDYFPYKETEAELEKSIPQIKQYLPNVYGIISSIQYFDNNQHWLTNICKLTKNIKHKTKEEQVKETSVAEINFANHINLPVGGNSNIKISGNYVDGVKQENDVIIKNGKVESTDKLLRVIENAEFKFKESNIFILKLLYTSYEGIKEFHRALYKELNKI
ncbi:hypothetical protein [Mucilaginibacter aquaedulcis]|uniref:hypothetical protein n=1 Tax=Mucilaginibacter aquaedulcis TaxID=1187081 RepID=UPI0025B3CAA5|nr:hypothetical protein [Mucilaginibacter aquaedulcis]MDN3546792.1 hypothetical protein [Mucilaginibacter aquaedulcis]